MAAQAASNGDRWFDAARSLRHIECGRPTFALSYAVRPEAWRIGAAGEGDLAAEALKEAYLGSTRGYTFQTALGPIFVVATDSSRMLAPGERASLGLAGRGVAIVPAAGAQAAP